MTVRIILMAVLLGTLVTGSLSAEETNPVLGKVGDFVLREADLDRHPGQPAACRAEALSG